MPSSLLALLASFAGHADATLFVHQRGYRRETWSYAQVLQVARAFAREMQQRGLGKGDRIVIWGPNCAEWAAAFYGCVLSGVVAVPLDWGASPESAARTVDEVDAKLVVHSRNSAAIAGGRPSLVLEDLRARVAHHSAQGWAAAVPSPDDVLELLFTSGTTAEPKGVVITHRNVLANLGAVEEELGRHERWLRWTRPLHFADLLPLSHVFGQLLGLFVPQLLGGTVRFGASLDPAEVLSMLRTERISVAVVVPGLLQSLRAHIERTVERLGPRQAAAQGLPFRRRWWRFRDVHRRFGWRFLAFLSGGATLDAETEEFWWRMGFPVVQGYGMTETAALISANHPQHARRHSVGKGLPGSQVKVDESGEILVRGPNVAPAYWQRGQLIPAADNDGWLHTGDLGRMDAEGNLYFVGRRKDVIVTAGGLNIYPSDLEQALRAQAGIRDAVVLSDERAGRAEARAVLLMQAGADASTAVRSANARLASHQHIHRWDVWGGADFPRTATGKPKLAEIESRLRATEGTAAPVASGGLTELASQVTGRALSRATALDELSSLERIELLSALESRYRVALDERVLAQAGSIGGLDEALGAPSTASPRALPSWPLNVFLRWVRVCAYHALAWPLTALLVRPRVVGRDHLRSVRGPLLVIANHVTYADPLLLLWALPFRHRTRMAIAMEGERLWSLRQTSAGPLRALLRRTAFALLSLFNVFPLFRRTDLRLSFQHAGRAVDRGYSVLVFPEGGRTPDGRLQPFQSGIGLLALRLGIPVLPLRIDGLYEWRSHPLRRVVIRIGRPVTYALDSTPERVARDLEHQLTAL